MIYPDGSHVQTKYDERGRTVLQKDTVGRKTEYTYDGSDRLTKGSFEKADHRNR